MFHQKTLSRRSRKKQKRSHLIKFSVCVEAWKQVGERWGGVVWGESEKAWPERTPYSRCVWGRQNKPWFSYPRFGEVLTTPWMYPGMAGEGPRRFTAPSKNQTGWVLISFVNWFFSKIEPERGRERAKEKRLRLKITGICLNPLLQILWFLRRRLLRAESYMLITAVANPVTVFLTHTGNSSTPGSRHMLLAMLVTAALLLRRVVETEQSPWLDQPLADLPPCPSPRTGEDSGEEKAELLAGPV